MSDRQSERQGAGRGVETSVTRLFWSCCRCGRECLPIRSESRCMCGHRLKEHSQTASSYRCHSAKCACQNFTYIVAEGAWILRCKCKHKHIDHDPNSKQCTKPGCKCEVFYSPWTCNCNHAWDQHQQVVQTRQVKLPWGAEKSELAFLTELGGGLASEVNRWDLVDRGQ